MVGRGGGRTSGGMASRVLGSSVLSILMYTGSVNNTMSPTTMSPLVQSTVMWSSQLPCDGGSYSFTSGVAAWV